MGLRNGDIVHAVSAPGRPRMVLDSVDASREAYEVFKDENRRTLEITRRGRRVFLEIDTSGACVVTSSGAP